MLDKADALNGEEFHAVIAGECHTWRRAGPARGTGTRTGWAVPVDGPHAPPDGITPLTAIRYGVHLAGACWDCAAYSPEERARGRMCFFSDPGTRTCGSQEECAGSVAAARWLQRSSQNCPYC